MRRTLHWQEEMAKAISDTTARPPRSADFRHWPRTYDSSFGENSIRGGCRVSCQEARSVGVKSDTCVLHVLCLSSRLTRISSYFTHFTQLWITSSLRDTDFSKGPILMYGKVRLLSYASQALSSNFFRRSAIGTRLRTAVSFVFPAPCGTSFRHQTWNSESTNVASRLMLVEATRSARSDFVYSPRLFL